MEVPHSFVGILRPILDTYIDAAVGLIGCRSRGIQSGSCEYDLLVVKPEHNPPATLRVGDSFVDLAFCTEADLASPRSLDFAISLAFMKPVRDDGLFLSSCASAARESLQRSYKRSTDEHLASSIKAMGRAEEAAANSADADAGFWLATAGYEFAHAWLLSSGTYPAPSHLLSQVRELSRGRPGMFEAFSSAIGLQGASRAACEARLEALSLVFDLKEQPGKDPENSSPESVRAAFELLRAKSKADLQAFQPVNAYCFLGLEVVRSIPQVLTRAEGKRRGMELAGPTPEGGRGLLARSVIDSLGVAGSPGSVKERLDGLRNQVLALARMT